MAAGTDIIARGLAAKALGDLQSKADLVNGKVPSSQLPSYVDDVIEGYYHDGKFYEDPGFQTEIEGESGKIYIDLNTSGTYRYSGDRFYLINEPLVIFDFSTQEYTTLLSGGTVNITDDRALTISDKEVIRFRVTNTEFEFTAGKIINKNGVTAFSLLDYSPTQDIVMIYYLVFTPVTGGYAASIIKTTVENGAQVNILEGVSVDGTDLPIINKKVNIDLSSKQDVLTAGENISIINNVISSIPGSGGTIGKNFVTDITVGYLQAGTEITEDMTISDILYQMLVRTGPVLELKSCQYEGLTIPSTIDSNWTSQEIDESVLTNGLRLTYQGGINGYVAFAYTKTLGDLTHVYQNGLDEFDLLPDLTKTTVTYNNVEYLMYVFEERAIIAAGDVYKLLWN